LNGNALPKLKTNGEGSKTSNDELQEKESETKSEKENSSEEKVEEKKPEEDTLNEKKPEDKAEDGDKKLHNENSEKQEPDEFPPEPRTFEALLPEVRRTNLEEFKNFYDPKDMCYIVQALYGGLSLKNDIQKENARREKKRPKKESGNLEKSDKKVLHRIRIHSPCVLAHLYQGEEKPCDDPWRPLTFFRPFTQLVHFQTKMKDALEELNEKWGAECPVSTIPVRAIYFRLCLSIPTN
jgi:hypothetical protein